jgi:hypothetical protein
MRRNITSRIQGDRDAKKCNRAREKLTVMSDLGRQVNWSNASEFVRWRGSNANEDLYLL